MGARPQMVLPLLALLLLLALQQTVAICPYDADWTAFKKAGAGGFAFDVKKLFDACCASTPTPPATTELERLFQQYEAMKQKLDPAYVPANPKTTPPAASTATNPCEAELKGDFAQDPIKKAKTDLDKMIKDNNYVTLSVPLVSRTPVQQQQQQQSQQSQQSQQQQQSNAAATNKPSVSTPPAPATVSPTPTLVPYYPMNSPYGTPSTPGTTNNAQQAAAAARSRSRPRHRHHHRDSSSSGADRRRRPQPTAAARARIAAARARARPSPAVLQMRKRVADLKQTIRGIRNDMASKKLSRKARVALKARERALYTQYLKLSKARNAAVAKATAAVRGRQ